VGFEYSHRMGIVVNTFHIHSFAVFHANKQKGTIATCILTARNCILSNMQNRILQLMQLIQLQNDCSFSTTINNNFIGENAVLDKMHRNGCKSMGIW
jgi:hypothetical protein